MTNPVRACLRHLPITLLLSGAPAMASAQTLRESLADVSRAGDIASALHTFSIFGGVPGISAATYDSGGMHLDSYKVPVAHSFAPVESSWLGGAAPYVEFTGGYIHGRENAIVSDRGYAAAGARVTYDVVTALSGVGLDIPVLEYLGGKTIIRPIFLAGYTRIESDARFSGVAAPVLAQVTRGMLTNVSLDSLLIGGAVAALHERDLGRQMTLQVGLRFNQIADIGLSASDPAFNITNGFSVATASVELKGPTGFEVGSLSVRWIAFASGTWVLGQNSDALGFSRFAELGEGLEFADGQLLPGVSAVSLRGSGIVGDGVTGWSVGVKVSF